ncbi:anti-sigma factor [Kribbella sp. CA-253562]|uniref:anti-sigma factor n=1 Tax=Kribbella sp. CA-253562 TaxID=3239942 RepID=UPI003D89B7A2
MTTHLDDEVLAQWAFEQTQPDHDATDHLRTCPDCATNLAELRQLVGAAEDLPRLESPPNEVWHRVAAELGFPAEGAPSSLDPQGAGGMPGAGRTPGAGPMAGAGSAAGARSTAGAGGAAEGTARRRGAGWTRRSVALAASVAAIAGVGLGVGGTLLFDSDDTPVATPQTVVQLAPLAGKSGSGTAGLVQAATGQQLKVSASGLPAAGGYYEVWLINEDGKRMVSLGVLAAGHDGTFQVPGDLPSQGYRIVDVSLEPDDGNPAHSLDSVIRGTLPA